MNEPDHRKIRRAAAPSTGALTIGAWRVLWGPRLLEHLQLGWPPFLSRAAAGECQPRRNGRCVHNAGMRRNRLLLSAVIVPSIALYASVATAADHAVYARAGSGMSQTFTYPNLSDVAEATYSLGVAGVNDAVVNNLARANARTGSVKIDSMAAKLTGPGMMATNWGQVARIEQKIKPAPGAGPSVVTIRLTTSGAANMQTATLGARLTGRVQIGSCIVGTSQYFTSTAASPAEYVDNCSGSPILSGAGSVGAPAILVSNLPPSGLTVSAEVSVTYEGSAFVGNIAANIQGGLAIDVTSGSVVYTSPTFLAGDAPDGGVTDAATGADASVSLPTTSDDGGGSPLGPPSSGGTSAESDGGESAASPAGASDGGCQVASVDSARLSAAGSALAVAMLTLRRRRRRADSSSS